MQCSYSVLGNVVLRRRLGAQPWSPEHPTTAPLCSSSSSSQLLSSILLILCTPLVLWFLVCCVHPPPGLYRGVCVCMENTNTPSTRTHGRTRLQLTAWLTHRSIRPAFMASLTTTARFVLFAWIASSSLSLEPVLRIKSWIFTRLNLIFQTYNPTKNKKG
jgi:hypothetical protein